MSPTSRNKKFLVGVTLVVVAALALKWSLSGPSAKSLARSESADDRLEAVTMIRERTSGDDALLERLADDSEPKVAVEAVYVMAVKRQPRHQPTLSRLATTAKHPTVRRAAAAALGNFKETPPSTLIELLTTPRDDEVRKGAAKGLARLAQDEDKRKASAPALYAALSDPDPEVRIWAITGIYNVTGQQFPGYDASKAPHEQRTVIAFIGKKLREYGLVN